MFILRTPIFKKENATTAITITQLPKEPGDIDLTGIKTVAIVVPMKLNFGHMFRMIKCDSIETVYIYEQHLIYEEVRLWLKGLTSLKTLVVSGVMFPTVVIEAFVRGCEVNIHHERMMKDFHQHYLDANGGFNIRFASCISEHIHTLHTNGVLCLYGTTLDTAIIEGKDIPLLEAVEYVNEMTGLCFNDGFEEVAHLVKALTISGVKGWNTPFNLSVFKNLTSLTLTDNNIVVDLNDAPSSLKYIEIENSVVKPPKVRFPQDVEVVNNTAL